MSCSNYVQIKAFDSTDINPSKGDTVISNLKKGTELCKILVKHRDKNHPSYFVFFLFFFFLSYFVLTTSIYRWIKEYNFNGTIRHNCGLKQFAIQPKGAKSHNLRNFKYAGQGASEVPL